MFPGVTAVPSLGHTPAIPLISIASGNDQLMIWGDTVHVPEVQTAFPEAGMAFDTDLAAAAASRKRMFDRVSADGVLIAGMHLHFPAFSRLARRGDAYALYPEAWVHDAIAVDPGKRRTARLLPLYPPSACQPRQRGCLRAPGSVRPPASRGRSAPPARPRGW